MTNMTNKELDKFYTSDEAAQTFIQFIKDRINIDEYDNIIEPSAGAGALLNHLPPHTIGVDLLPERDDIVQCDFFDFQYPTGKNITIGNPPFGSRSKLAVEFFKKAATHCDAIAFIIPVTWEKYSIHKQLPEGWALIATERLPEASFELGGKPYKVRCCMQLWVKQGCPDGRVTTPPSISHPDFELWQYNGTETSLKVFDNEFDFAVLRQGFGNYNEKKYSSEQCDKKKHWMLFKASSQDVLSKLNSLDFDALSKSNTTTPGFGKADVVSLYTSMTNHRHLSQPTGENPYFDFVKKEDCEFAIRQAYPKTVAKEFIDDQSYYFIKPKVKGVWEVFNSFEWQSAENKLMLGGSKIPCLDKHTVVKFYEKYVDLRQCEKVEGEHPDFQFVNKNDDWDFCMSSSPCIVRSKEYFTEKGGAFCSHFIKANVPDLFETFNTIAWQSKEAKDVLGGSRFPTADTVDIVKVYSMSKEGLIPHKKGDWRIQKEKAKTRKKHTYK